MPEIYVDQVMETLDGDGNNVIKKQYNDAVTLCESMGKKISGLSAVELGKLGTRRYQLAIVPGKIVIRQESWGFRMSGEVLNPGECRFELSHQGDLTVKIPGHVVVYDLKEDTLEQEEKGLPEAFGLPFRPVSEEFGEVAPPEVQGTHEEFMGQQVVKWEYPDGATAVIWAEGQPWGFHIGPSEHTFATPGSLVLQKTQKKGNFHLRMTTHSFTVGTPVDFDTFAIPETAAELP